MKIIYNNIIPFKGYKLINLFGIIFARKEAIIKDRDINHEKIHTAQMLEMLILPFYLWYLIEFLIRWICNGFKWKQAYRKIWFEQEAYFYQDRQLYLDYRKHYEWFNFK